MTENLDLSGLQLITYSAAKNSKDVSPYQMYNDWVCLCVCACVHVCVRVNIISMSSLSCQFMNIQ